MSETKRNVYTPHIFGCPERAYLSTNPFPFLPGVSVVLEILEALVEILTRCYVLLCLSGFECCNDIEVAKLALHVRTALFRSDCCTTWSCSSLTYFSSSCMWPLNVCSFAKTSVSIDQRLNLCTFTRSAGISKPLLWCSSSRMSLWLIGSRISFSMYLK